MSGRRLTMSGHRLTLSGRLPDIVRSPPDNVRLPNKVSLSRTGRDLSRTRQTAFSVDSDLEKIAQSEHILPFFRIGRFVGESGAKVEGLHFDRFYGRSLRTFHGRTFLICFKCAYHIAIGMVLVCPIDDGVHIVRPRRSEGGGAEFVYCIYERQIRVV